MSSAKKEFMQIPNWFARTSAFSPAEKAIIFYVWSLTNARPSLLSIREATGLSNYRVSEAIKALRRDSIMELRGYNLRERNLWKMSERSKEHDARAQKIMKRRQRDNARRVQEREQRDAVRLTVVAS